MCSSFSVVITIVGILVAGMARVGIGADMQAAGAMAGVGRAAGTAGIPAMGTPATMRAMGTLPTIPLMAAGIATTAGTATMEEGTATIIDAVGSFLRLVTQKSGVRRGIAAG